MTKYPEPTNDRQAVARLACMADDIEVSITEAVRALDELRAELSRLLHEKASYPVSDDDDP
jgi:hypothetical protein